MANPVQEEKSKVEQARAIVKRNMAWGAGAGVLPFPAFDLAAITGVQLKLIKELADLYGIPFQKNLAKSIVFSLVGCLGGSFLASVGAAASLKLLPGVGPLLAVSSLPAAAAGLTYATGQVFIQHFEAGGTLLDFAPETMKEYFREQFSEGKAKAPKETAKA